MKPSRSKFPPVLETLLKGPPDESKLARNLADPGFRDELASKANESLTDKKSYVLTPPKSEHPIYAAGGFSPTGPFAKCEEIECRTKNVKSFARMACLYSNLTVIPDFVSPLFHAATQLEKPPAHLVREIQKDLTALRTLTPLVNEGLIKFAPVSTVYCASCLVKTKSQIRQMADSLWNSTVKAGAVDILPRRDGTTTLGFYSPIFSAGNHGIVYRFEAPKGLFKDRRLKRELPITSLAKSEFQFTHQHALELFAREIQTALFEASGASKCSAILTTDSRLDSLVFRSLGQERGIEADDLNSWERLRSIDLPWVADLTVDELLRLRDASKGALPRFRARLNRELVPQDQNQTANDTKTVAVRLREEAEELDSELALAMQGIRGTRRTAAFVLFSGLSLVIYGLGSGNPAGVAAGTTLLSALSQFHTHHERDRRELMAHRSKPAFVLLSARQLLRDRSH